MPMSPGAERRTSKALAAMNAASEEKGEALWELKPNHHRIVSGRASPVHGEPQEVEGRTNSLCQMGFFGGCTICTVSEDEIIRPRAEFERVDKHWEPGDLLCSTSDRRCGAKTTEEYIEELEETTSIGEGGDDSISEIESARYQGPPGLIRRNLDGSQDTPLLRELEALMRFAGEFFASGGWLLEATGGDRFRFNGRGVKLSMRHPGLPPPPFQHLLKATSYETAERAAHFTVCDGSLRQPLLDYLMQTGKNESYDERGTENIAVVEGAGKFLDFNIAGTEDRILEMRSATIQADMRRSATALHAGPLGGAPAGARVSALQTEGAKLLGSRGLGTSIAASLQIRQGTVHGV